MPLDQGPEISAVAFARALGKFSYLIRDDRETPSLVLRRGPLRSPR
jgi:hypothetical protein